MRTLILGTAGHIDHGKTALVRALTGVETDRLPEEQRRGITIDIGFASLQLGDLTLGIVDVPGHERFIKNMLAGAAGIDVAMLVVAADDSVMPQTREHLAILELLNVEQGLVVITKCDRTSADWLELVREDIRELVDGTFLQDAPMIATSATTGQGIDDLKDLLLELTATVQQAPEERPFRLAVDRAFMVQGLGTIVTGSVWSGSVEVGDNLELLPQMAPVQVRGIQTHGESVQRIARGQRAAINLGGIHHQELQRGDVVAAPGYLRPAQRFTVQMRTLQSSPWPIQHRARVRLHLGTAEIMAQVRLLHGNELAPGETGLAQLWCDTPTVAAGHQPFVVRAVSPLVTVGGGHVLETCPHHIARRREAEVTALVDLQAETPLDRVAAVIRRFAMTSWTALDVCRDADLPAVDVNTLLASMRTNGALIDLVISPQRTVSVHRGTLDHVSQRIGAVVNSMHDAAPLELRFPRTQIAQRIPEIDRALLESLFQRMIDDDVLCGDDRAIGLTERTPRLNGKQEKIRSGLIETYRSAHLQPPLVADVAAAMKHDQRQVQAIVEFCAAEGDLVHVGSGIFVDREAESDLRGAVLQRMADGPGLTMSEMRDAWGTTRKYAIPFAEYLDRIGVTRRVGDRRVPGRHAHQEPSS